MRRGSSPAVTSHGVPCAPHADVTQGALFTCSQVGWQPVLTEDEEALEREWHLLPLQCGWRSLLDLPLHRQHGTHPMPGRTFLRGRDLFFLFKKRGLPSLPLQLPSDTLRPPSVPLQPPSVTLQPPSVTL